MKIILFGPPGVGKGTQAVVLAKKLNILHICSGDLLRKAVSEGTPIGKKAKGFMDKGELVPDNMVSKLTLQRIEQPDARGGFLLDGYPRNLSQAIELEKALLNDQQGIDAVFYLNADQDVIVQRLSGRRLCSKCQANFHIKNMPPKKEGICDYCGGKLYQRRDDNEETIKNRLKVYHEATASLIDHYRDKNRLIYIDANQEVGVVLDKILETLKSSCQETK